jgi:soluble lytic murein transglycosylase-like protein
MQLMWHTARQMAATTGVALTSRAVLRDPEINLALGQAYLQTLLGRQGIAGNLVLLATAYNLGPARLARWSSADTSAADPLFFLETMPSRETRVFVERVLVNYWIYRRRFGRPTRGLDLLAAGGWPIYAGEAQLESENDARAR